MILKIVNEESRIPINNRYNWVGSIFPLAFQSSYSARDRTFQIEAKRYVWKLV